jgi:hypothetical protein
MESPDSTDELQTLLEKYVSDAASRAEILNAVKAKKLPEHLELRNTTQPAQQ